MIQAKAGHNECVTCTGKGIAAVVTKVAQGQLKVILHKVSNNTTLEVEGGYSD